MFPEDDLLPLSALQHLLFCERQCARTAVLAAYQRKKQEEIQHPFLKEKTTVGLLPHLQAALLARYLRKDLDDYPAFLWK